MMHLEGGRALAASNVPQPCCLVLGAGRQCLSVEAKYDTVDPKRMSLEAIPLGFTLGFTFEEQ